MENQISVQPYDVFNNDFQKIGVVKADSAEAAMAAAKKRFPLVPAPLVQLTPEPSPARRSYAPRGK